MQADFVAVAETEPHSLHTGHLAGPSGYEQNGTPSTSHPRSTYPSFRLPAAPPLEAAVEDRNQSIAATRNGRVPMPSTRQSPQAHLLPPDNASLGGNHNQHSVSHAYYSDISRASQTPSTPSNASPRFAASSPSHQTPSMTSHPALRESTAPSRDASDETLDDSYTQFILYCNPSFANTTDAAELKRLFRTPPKSDGKAFSTWTLFELIRKFDAKEIKTWTQLALDLGVEPPDTEKGQSTQKVQQYSVRLKRWMRAMHIDAFFEYLLGKQHPYYLHIPPPEAPFPADGRDGVPLEEDLAIRALDPKFRPKRGRRKADEGEDDTDTLDGTPPRKRPHLDTSVPFGNVLQPQSAYPNSAHPDNMDGFLAGHDPWTATAITPSSAMTVASASNRLNPSKNLTPYSASPLSGQQIRWRVNTQDNPTTPHPLSAVTPQSAHPDYFDEPQSAITPSSAKPRARRRHGPAVSSAWPSNASSSGKLRGRPPSNRSVRDGPFVTFPANPRPKESTPLELKTPGHFTPIVERSQADLPATDQHFRFPPTPASAISPKTMESQLQHASQQRGHRLSLQVPQNVGNPVQLATPTVLVTAEQEPTPTTGLLSSAMSADPGRSSPGHFFPRSHDYTVDQSMSAPPVHSSGSQGTISRASAPVVSTEAMTRALVAELIRAPLFGRRRRIRGSEAKMLAAAILQPLQSRGLNNSMSPEKPVQDTILSIAICSCLGLTSAVGLGSGGPSGGIRGLKCIRFRVGGDGYESPIDDDDEDADAEATNSQGDNVRETFDVSFTVSFGPLHGEWTFKGLSATLQPTSDKRDAIERNIDEQDSSSPNTAEAWKAKFLAAQQKLWEREEESQKLRDKILETIL